MKINAFSILCLTAGLFVASCSPEGPVDPNPPGGTDMATISIPDGFNFDMYKDTKLIIIGNPKDNYITKVQVFRKNLKSPVWSSVFSENISKHTFDLRATDTEVDVVVSFRGGATKKVSLPVLNKEVVLDVSNMTYTDPSMFSAKTACTDSLANDDAGAAANSFGYGTKIVSVTNQGSYYEITFKVDHSGCGGPNCKSLSHFAIEVANGNLNGTPTTNLGTVTGSLAYSLPQYSFDGFKLDGVGNIGGGVQNSFTITYKVNSLQDTRFVAKAGNNYDRIANFTVSDFTCVMNSGTPPPPPVTDTDNDGVDDNTDEFPNDPALAYTTVTDTASFAAEDNWPWEGDFDFNDVVMPYWVKSYFSGDDKLVKSQFFYKFRARGARNENGMGFSYLTDPSNVSVSGYNHNETYHTSVNGIESGSSAETSVIFEDLVINDLPSFNTIPGVMPIIDEWDSVLVEFTNPVDGWVDSTFNLFLVVDKTRGMEIHLPNHPPTFLADQNKIGYGLDAGDPATGVYYKQADGKPWVLNVPGEFKYPFEQEEITTAYLNFLNWAQSGGTLNQDWYDNDIPANIDANYIYDLH